ncbi:hypothetical protein CLV24_11556 [Pontibacter ummariensis]|uniref:DUF7699 domain-containing protein n=1 Tax=Pontibacter ummariensis TaxID=1610492 RepID=A0A239HZP6_9BACT|nr:hypothetical protein [Pontibacter ummariensis]PRY10139.1 hypothetical protein CLV24_11556 [Pontibacter ummariensis]SNS86741.1 hypothetical protein SAMN06296052_11556 [Pontibacter ummariensis]
MNLTVGCKVVWTESVYTPYTEGKESDFIGERTITGRITAEGYSKKTNYHFFTIHVYGAEGVNAHEIEENSKIIRRGVVLYPKCRILATPANYDELVKEKAQRKENSSPVCYAHVKGLREGFEE